MNPRIVNQSRLAEYLGKSKGWLSSHLPDLRKEGFPSKIPLIDGYDLREVDAWIESQKTGGNTAKKRVNGTFK